MTNTNETTQILKRAVEQLSPSHAPTVGCSACLCGDPVRYDGSHKQIDSLLLLKAFDIQLQPLCPEVSAGMGTPRPPVHRVKRNGDVIAILEIDKPQQDHSVALFNAAETLCHQWSTVDAWVLKARSPSCGLDSSPLFDQNGKQLDIGNGVFANKICDSHAGLHLDEDDLATPIHSAIFAIALRLSLQLRKTPHMACTHSLAEILLPILKSPRKAEAFRRWLKSCDKNQLGRLLQLPDY